MGKVTVPYLVARKREGQRIVMITAYDATFARLVEMSGADIVLVGDSLGMVVQGRQNTLAVTLDEMIYHSRCVRRGLSRAHLAVDLPFMSYQLGPEQALESAGRVMKEGGAEAVKLEGGKEVAPTVARLVAAGIPVMGHVGLTPQSVHAMGGFKVQAKDEASARRLEQDAKALQDAGCYAIVLEGIPADVARRVSRSLRIPTIGIGAGVGCDGQVLVMHDLLGLDDRFHPRFVKRYAELGPQIVAAFEAYGHEVREGQFPTEAHSFTGDETSVTKPAPKPSSKPKPKPATDSPTKPVTEAKPVTEVEPAAEAKPIAGKSVAEGKPIAEVLEQTKKAATGYGPEE
jgi:3-methyl-2-oxobutanoate hydroxymethyltransferase